MASRDLEPLVLLAPGVGLGLGPVPAPVAGGPPASMMDVAAPAQQCPVCHHEHPPGSVCGTCCHRWVAEQFPAAAAAAVVGAGSSGHVALIDRFCVLRRYRRQGVGARLLRVVLDDVVACTQAAARGRGLQTLREAAPMLPPVALILPPTPGFHEPLKLVTRPSFGFVLAPERLAIAPGRDPSALFALAPLSSPPPVPAPAPAPVPLPDFAPEIASASDGKAAAPAAGSPVSTERHTEVAVLLLTPQALLAVATAPPMPL